jgi:tetratricopeptide (TPR) repeat protein
MNATDSSGERDALLHAARDLRARQRLPEALATLARLQAQHPRFSRLYQERGHCYVLLRDAPRAIDSLLEAVRLNPTLPTSWDMLEQLYRMTGDAAQAAAAARHLGTLQQLPPEVVVASSLLADGDLLPAEEVIRDYLRRDNNNAGAMRLLARICRERKAPEEALLLLESALQLVPDYAEARLDYGMALLEQQKPALARREAERLLAHDPGNREYLKLLGAACIRLGDHEPLVGLYEKLLAGLPPGPEVAELRQWRGNALKTLGRQPEAIADFHAALAACPDYGVVWFSLANLKTYRFTDDEIARMRMAESLPGIAGMEQVYLCFALGKALEDRGDHAASWQYYERGNAARRAIGRWRAQVADEGVRRFKALFTAEFFAARAGWGVTDTAPIFILGLPRSGSTLIEQILASHPQVEGTQELTEMGSYAGELCGSDPDCGLPLHPEALLRLTARDARRLGERFITETRVYRKLGRPFFLDKMPNNFWHIGLIQLLLPEAKIIDVRREPMSCCFSNLKQLFGPTSQEFSYDIGDIARYYRTYLELMRHWDKVLPGRVLRVHYEDVVLDLEGSVRRMLEHCGLSFEPACLSFHETRRSVRTPSSEQVRKPISREAVHQWRHYEPWLGSLQDALGDALTRYRT